MFSCKATAFCVHLGFLTVETMTIHRMTTPNMSNRDTASKQIQILTKTISTEQTLQQGRCKLTGFNTSTCNIPVQLTWLCLC
eukprot:2164661-Amphidinium_carterae.1